MNNKNNYVVDAIFPVGIYITQIPEDIELIFNVKEDEQDLLEANKYQKKHVGFVSKNSYLLNQKKYSKLKSFILNHCKNYGDNYLSIDSKEYIMSQSWITIKPPNAEHDTHIHPNSVISGVLYYGNYDKDTPGITFTKSYNVWDFKYNRSLRIKTKKNPTPNKFNTQEMDLEVGSNTLVLFPSWLEHGVAYNNTKKDRKSIAFNVLPQVLGNEASLTELKLDNYE